MSTTDKPSSKRQPQRGTSGDLKRFARLFVRSRLDGFKKDMQICLTGVPSKTRPGLTHAYFPALMSCCSTLEYLAGLYCGRTDPCSDQELARYATRFLPQPEYSPDMIRVLHRALRHSIAHRGIASGIWVDRNPTNHGRRITWKIAAENEAPAILLAAHEGVLRNDSPWECRYTHRVHIRLGRLWRQIRASALGSGGYCDELADPRTLRNFEACMRELYPT